MPQSLLPLLKTLTFTEADRAQVVLSDSNLIRLDPEANCVKLRHGTSGYPLTGLPWVVSPLAAPTALRGFTGFQPIIKHVGPASAPVTSAGYRLTDGALQYWHDGTEWVEATNPTWWNTAAEVSTNIGTWSQGITAKRFGAVVLLGTADASTTPELHAVKFGTLLKVHSALESLLYRALAPALREGIRAVTDLGYKLPAEGDSIDMAAVLQTIGVPFKVSDLDSVFNRDSDPGLDADLLVAYDSGTKRATLSEVLAAETQVQIQAVYQPTVAIETTHPDFIEVASAPALAVTGPELQGATLLPVSDTLLVDESTGVALEYLPAARGRLAFSMDVTAPSGVDLKRLTEAVLDWAAANPIIRVPETDERYRLRVMDEFHSFSRPSNNGAQLARAAFAVEDVLIFRRTTRNRTAVLQFAPDFQAEE